jgi:hypothetical protein
MKDKDITNAEANGFAQLKWDAAEKGDIEAALEMQKAETESLCRLAKSRNAPRIESGDEWKNQG